MFYEALLKGEINNVKGEANTFKYIAKLLEVANKNQ